MWLVATYPLSVSTELMYLCWQEPAWDDDGYFWAWERDVPELIKYNNTPNHPFAFKTKAEARKFARKHKIRGFKLVEFKV